MYHADLLDYVAQLAEYNGLLTHYCTNSRLCRGHNGMPDLLIISLSGKGILWAEIKTDNARDLSSDQTLWRYALLSNGARWEVFLPIDKDTGRIDHVLREMK
jgi:hypothetical protein